MLVSRFQPCHGNMISVRSRITATVGHSVKSQRIFLLDLDALKQHKKWKQPVGATTSSVVGLMLLFNTGGTTGKWLLSMAGWGIAAVTIAGAMSMAAAAGSM